VGLWSAGVGRPALMSQARKEVILMEETIVDKVKEMTDEELIGDFQATYHCVHVAECFSTKDLAWLEIEARELERRGYRIEPAVNIVKEEEEET